MTLFKPEDFQLTEIELCNSGLSTSQLYANRGNARFNEWLDGLPKIWKSRVGSYWTTQKRGFQPSKSKYLMGRMVGGQSARICCIEPIEENK